ncbi:MAG: beta-galactosidase [Phycisphaerales bacterium]
MASVTYDGRSFMLDGRRIWLVSGAINYARTPRDLWAQRIHAAKRAGLNTVETPVVWARHEPRPGQFDFKGDNDLRHFIQLIAQAGLWCILRPGPYIGAAWDFGGLPPWLTSVKAIRLRVSNGPFLEACSRYLTAVSEQVRDLQATGPKGGPLLLIQNESQWTCGDDPQGQAYLGEINRYLRESGLGVPTINGNNLWQGVEGEIDCWTGSGDMLSTLRQLATVRPEQPRLVIEQIVGAPSTWGTPAAPPTGAAEVERRLAEVLAAGGQFNIAPFHGGTSFGFSGGRLPEHESGFVTASHDHGAPLSEAGLPAPSLPAVRRLCTFASRFARVLSNLDPAYRPVVIAPADPAPEDDARPRAKRESAAPGPTVIHTSGSQGGVAFIFNPAAEAERPKGAPADHVTLLLPDGTPLPVDITGQAVTWCLFDALIGARARLDYCNLSPFAAVGRTLILFGPPGADGRLSVNGSPLAIPVPAEGKPPATLEHESLTLIIATADHLETIQAADDAVYLGASDLTASGQPIAAGIRTCTRIDAEGKTTHVPVVHPPPHKRAEGRLALSEWAAAPMGDYCDGTSPRFASIDGPADLASLGSPYGYGWYRIRLKSPPSGKVRLAFPSAGDRLLVYLDGEPAGVIGRGPGAEGELHPTFAKGPRTLVMLADNLGRLSGGNSLGESKGLFGPFYEVKALRPGKPILKTGEPVPILSFRSPIWEVNPGDLTLHDRITWTLAHRRKTPVLLTIGPSPVRALLMLNGKPFAILERHTTERHVLLPDQLKAGVNLIQAALFPEAASADLKDVLHTLGATTTLDECTADLASKAEWAFAKWEPPRAAAFARGKGAGRAISGCPSWWSATFPPADRSRPLFFDAAGLSKGQLYLNGRHICRYFVATADGKPVPPQTLYYLPAPWVSDEADNQVLIFDEHGAGPARTRLVYDAPRGLAPEDR